MSKGPFAIPWWLGWHSQTEALPDPEANYEPSSQTIDLQFPSHPGNSVIVGQTFSP